MNIAESIITEKKSSIDEHKNKKTIVILNNAFENEILEIDMIKGIMAGESKLAIAPALVPIDNPITIVKSETVI